MAGRSPLAVRAEVAREVSELTERTGQAPGLATILVGDDPASAVYVANKRKACAEVGIADHHQHLPADATEQEVADLIDRCNEDPEVSGILLQLPVPAGLDGAALTGRIAPDKDVDGLTPISAGRLAQGTAGAETVHAARRDRAARRLRGARWRARRRSSSVARTWSASRSQRCCWRAMRP